MNHNRSAGVSTRNLAVTRREALCLGGAALAGMSLLEWLTLGEVSAADPAVPKNRFPHMVQEFFVRQVRKAERKSLNRKMSLKTKQDAEAYVQLVRKLIAQSLGPYPKKTPLKPRITGTIERDAYTIENIIFESRPGFLVTGHLYIPKGKDKPMPGVVGVCGHSRNGKAYSGYQAFSQGLARMGYVVFIIDPLGQGERLQYLDEKLQSKVGVGVGEHLLAGNQQFLVGEFIGTWRAWDGIRALDYLLTRPQVDPKQVGITGNSGGGTMTTLLCGYEPRWAMAAPSCYVTTFLHNLENELPADTEQCPPGVLALGLDHDDFLAAQAPKPVIILAKERDYFDVRGAEEAYRRLRHLYKLLGHEDKIGLFIGPTEHGYSQENREAMYRWFNDVTGVSKARTEPKLVIEQDKTLYCTPKGQVGPLGSKPIYVFTAEKSKALAKKRKPLQADALRKAVRELLKLPKRQGVPHYRILRTMRSNDYPYRYVTPYVVETEPDISALVYRVTQQRHQSRPPRTKGRAIIYVAHHSGDAELRDETLIRQLVKDEPKSTLFTCDVRGIGESKPQTTSANSFLQPYGSDYFYAIHSLMLDRPYIGQKTHDVLCVLDWVKSFGFEQIHLAGLRWGALPACFAAVLSDHVTQITLKNALKSYSEIAEAQTYDWPLSALVPRVLEHFDLPDCYRFLKTKGLTQIEPWGAQAKT